MEFKHRQNEFVTKDNIGDRGFFISRSVAVVGSIVVKYKDELYVLINKRGSAMDSPHLYNMPCGYLDWDESATDGIYRELFEECNLDIKTLVETSQVYAAYLEQPWFVHHKPNENRQNVTLRFGLYCEVDKLPVVSSINADENEVDEVLWLNIEDESNIDDIPWAFKHDKVLKEFLLNLYTY